MMDKIDHLVKLSKDASTLKQIISDVFDVDIDERTRLREVVDARRVYAKIMRDQGYSLSLVAGSFKSVKNHATIIHYLKSLDDIFAQDKKLFLGYIKCKEKMTGVKEKTLRADLEGYEEPVKEKTSEEIIDGMYKQIVKDMERKINDLTERCNQLSSRNQEYSRIESIIKLVLDRTPKGSEERIEVLIRRMFNGLH